MINGKMTGVRLSGGPEALVAKLGLKPDDVVTSVNGMPLDSPAHRVPPPTEWRTRWTRSGVTTPPNSRS